jgi:hydroxyacylglutathione hydrolase
MLEPDNPALAAHQRQVAALRHQDQPTLPTSIALEREINPFLRCDQAAIRAASGCEKADQALIFGAIREMRNHY